MSDVINAHDLGIAGGYIIEAAMQRVIDQLKAENAKLRELVALWSVINKHMSLCATTDCGQCPVREECEESVYLEGLLGIDLKGLSWRVQERMAEATDVQDENAKLRELCADMLNYFTEPVSKRNNLKERFARLDDIGDRMHELGVEVE